MHEKRPKARYQLYMQCHNSSTFPWPRLTKECLWDNFVVIWSLSCTKFRINKYRPTWKLVRDQLWLGRFVLYGLSAMSLPVKDNNYVNKMGKIAHQRGYSCLWQPFAMHWILIYTKAIFESVYLCFTSCCFREGVPLVPNSFTRIHPATTP